MDGGGMLEILRVVDQRGLLCSGGRAKRNEQPVRPMSFWPRLPAQKASTPAEPCVPRTIRSAASRAAVSRITRPARRGPRWPRSRSLAPESCTWPLEIFDALLLRPDRAFRGWRPGMSWAAAASGPPKVDGVGTTVSNCTGGGRQSGDVGGRRQARPRAPPGRPAGARMWRNGMWILPSAPGWSRRIGEGPWRTTCWATVPKNPLAKVLLPVGEHDHQVRFELVGMVGQAVGHVADLAAVDVPVDRHARGKYSAGHVAEICFRLGRAGEVAIAVHGRRGAAARRRAAA